MTNRPTNAERARQLVAVVAQGDIDTARDLLDGLGPRTMRELVLTLAKQVPYFGTEAERLEAIVAAIAPRFGTTAEDVYSPSRRQEDVDARAVACYAERLCGSSYSFIGRQIGRDHTTVLHQCGRVAETPRLRKIAMTLAEHFGWERGAVA